MIEKPAPKGEWISSAEQLDRWVAGESVHRQYKFELAGADGLPTGQVHYGDECTPDFSCCMPELKADEETRRAFAAAGEQERMKFLGAFLGACIELASRQREVGPEWRVHIAGKEPSS